MPIRVLYLIDALIPGGTERQLVETIKRLDRSRIMPHICTLKHYGGMYDELDIPKASLGFIGFSHPTLLSCLWQLSRFVRTHRIDIIQTFFQDPCLLAAMIKPFHQVKLIGSFRDLGFWRSPNETRKMRLAYRMHSGFIANSKAVKEHFVNHDGIRPEKIEVVHNGIDLESIERVRAAANPDATGPLVGIVANLNRPVKRVDDFIRAAAIVHRERPDTRFMVLGDGHLRDELTALAGSLGLADSMTFAGMVDNPITFIKGFKVGVISSETEGLCNAIIEYMACGIPVVATDTGGNPELIADGENGFLGPVGDIQTLAEKTLRLLSDDVLSTGIGMRNKEKIRLEFSWLATVERQSRYYERLLVS